LKRSIKYFKSAQCLGKHGTSRFCREELGIISCIHQDALGRTEVVMMHPNDQSKDAQDFSAGAEFTNAWRRKAPRVSWRWIAFRSRNKTKGVHLHCNMKLGWCRTIVGKKRTFWFVSIVSARLVCHSRSRIAQYPRCVNQDELIAYQDQSVCPRLKRVWGSKVGVEVKSTKQASPGTCRNRANLLEKAGFIRPVAADGGFRSLSKAP